MALLDFEGFETQPQARTNRVLETGWALPSATYGRNGNGMRITGTSMYAEITELSIADGDTVIIGIAYFPENTDAASNNSRLIQLRSDSTVIFTVDLSSSVLGFVGGSVSDFGTSTLTSGSWYYIEVKAKLSNSSSNGTYEVRLDGITEVSGTAVNNTDSSLTADRFRVYIESNGRNFYLDDMYVCDGTGSVNNDFLGDVEVRRLAPTGNGTTNSAVGSDGNSTDNYLLVDETTTIHTSDYVELRSIGDVELYSTGTLAAGEVALGVMVSAAFTDGAPSEQYDGVLRIGSTNYEAGGPLQGSVSLLWRDWLYETNPATSVAWVEDDLDGVEFGITRKA